MQIEKRPGYDWTVVFRDPDTKEVISGKVFGVMSAEKAAADARVDLAMPDDWDVVAVFRVDVIDDIFAEAFG